MSSIPHCPVTRTVDLLRLAHNLTQVRAYVGDRKIIAVVKANAYGHGALAVSEVLSKQGVAMLGVAHIEEGIALRQGGIKTPILVMTGLFSSAAREMVKHRLTPVISSELELEALRRHLKRSPITVHIKLDTGMGRLGLSSKEAASFIQKTIAADGIHVAGILSHFSCADQEDTIFTRKQLRTFMQVRKTLQKLSPIIPYCHMANSAAIVRFPSAYLDAVRPGLMLYGYVPFSKSVGGLKPVMQVKAKVLSIKTTPAGTPISYGGTFVTKEKTRIAIVAIGYAGGYPRALSNRGVMIAAGKRVPVVGRVCMDMTMLDITEASSLAVGDWVTVMGSEGNVAVWADELATAAETTPYEILCRLGNGN